MTFVNTIAPEPFLPGVSVQLVDYWANAISVVDTATETGHTEAYVAQAFKACDDEAERACTNTVQSFGCLASDIGYHLPNQVLRSAAGWYIGTFNEGPVSRESVEYWGSAQEADGALASGHWTQRSHP